MAGSATITKLIVNSPYAEPAQHWSYDRESQRFELKTGRRSAGYITATPGSRSFDDPGVFHELPMVNKIRPRIAAWRDASYTGVTGVTKRLLDHWRDPDQRADRRLFFCQLEAIETLIWLAEAPDSERVGIAIPSDGGDFARYCTKMATGSGKTIVMAMLIAWQALNKVAYPHDARFSKHVFVVAPGLTVRQRLHVLLPAADGNYYDEFNIVPAGMEDTLRQAKVLIRNRQALSPLDPDAGPRVIKKGKESDEAYTRRVLEELSASHNLLVINDEAHHAWRLPPDATARGVDKEELQEATLWIGGLDRIHRTRGVNACHDFSATPFIPSGKTAGESSLFGWIVSDFSLNDAIESGLVKTPRVVVRDDGSLTTKYKSRFYHIYADTEVKDDLGRAAKAENPLPDLVVNAYYFLGKYWQETYRAWRDAGAPTPPVMITVANRTETAARVAAFFTQGKIDIEELKDPARTLHIDSKVLAKAESRVDAPEDDPTSALDDADEEEGERDGKATPRHVDPEALRLMVDTVGQLGKPGEQIRNVISVGMLSEGWDAKTVTHIMGLRAFTSQLLCEQVVGRGLRRTSYEVDPVTGLFEAEHVNVFGVPFTFLPHESGGDTPPPPPSPKTRIEAVIDKAAYEICWPNVLRVDHDYRATLSLDIEQVPELTLDAADVAILVEMAPPVDGRPDLSQLSEISLLGLTRRFRMQRIVFETARDIYALTQPSWSGNREQLLAQLVKLVELVIASDRIRVHPQLFDEDPLRRRFVLTMQMNKIVQHIWQAIYFQNAAGLAPVFDVEHPVRSTGDMRVWFTSKPCAVTQRSHINKCVYDSTWEATEAYELDRGEHVAAWTKNDHLGFEVLYTFNGVVHKYLPDFLVRLQDGRMLVLEVKGQDDEAQLTKRRFLDEWVNAVNQHGGFGTWAWAVSKQPKDVLDILERLCPSALRAT